MDSLTNKQAQFVMHYLETNNATLSAKRAGYSKKTAHSIGHENLRKPEIAEFIKGKREELWDVFKQYALEALERLISIARDENVPYRVRLEACKEILDRAGYRPQDRKKYFDDNKAITKEPKEIKDIAYRARQLLMKKSVD